MSDQDLLQAVRSAIEAYRTRWADAWPHRPAVYRVPDWGLTLMLTDLAADGRPATRDELDRYASEYLGHECVVRLYGEEP